MTILDATNEARRHQLMAERYRQQAERVLDDARGHADSLLKQAKYHQREAGRLKRAEDDHGANRS